MTASSRNLIPMSIQQRAGGAGATSVNDAHWRAAGGILEKLFRCPAWHADASVRGRIAGKVARMHADGSGDPHEIGHGSALKAGAWRTFVFFHPDILNHDFAAGIHIVPVKG